MHIVCVDLGHYSLKILVGRQERGDFVLENKQEIIIPPIEEVTGDESPRWNMQQKIIHQVLEEFELPVQLILNTPYEIYTSRFLNLPVKSKKKALQMLPFKLEDEIPYSSSEAHIQSMLKNAGEETKAMAVISKKQEFAHFYQLVKEQGNTPSLITTDNAAYAILAEKKRSHFPQTFAILDIGHHTAKAYFFHDGELVSQHISYVAGSHIDESISTQYKIGLEDAKDYKHQNAFFLLKEQYEDVTKEQAHFAEIMEKSVRPLVNDFQRWDISSRIKAGSHSQEVYFTGGSSQIKNITAFFTQELGIKCSMLKCFHAGISPLLSLSKKDHAHFDTCAALAASYSDKSKSIQLLTGDFTGAASDDLPLHALSFWASRITAITTILLIGVFIESFFLLKEEDALDKHITSLAKNPTLELTNRQKRLVKKDPLKISSALKRKKKYLFQEISTIQAALSTNALSKLIALASTLKQYEAEVTQFDALSKADFNITVKLPNKEQWTSLKNILMDDLNLTIDENEKDLSLTLSGVDQE